MTIYTNLTIILPKAAQALAQGLCVAAAGEAGAGMFTTGLSATGEAPATHFISSGAVEAKFADILALATITSVDGVESLSNTTGYFEAIMYMVTNAGAGVTQLQASELLLDLDVSEQPPFVALDRLGLKIVTE